jgi:hypothetical protein
MWTWEKSRKAETSRSILMTRTVQLAGIQSRHPTTLKSLRVRERCDRSAPRPVLDISRGLDRSPALNHFARSDRASCLSSGGDSASAMMAIFFECVGAVGIGRKRL